MSKRVLMVVLLFVIILIAIVICQIYSNYNPFEVNPRESYEIFKCFGINLPVTSKDKFWDALIKTLGWGATVTATFIAAFNLRETAMDRKRQAAYKMIGDWNELGLAKSRREISAKCKADFVKRLDDDGFFDYMEKHHSAEISRLLGVLEDMALAYRLKYADKKVLILSMEPAFLYYYSILARFIEVERKRSNNDDTIFCELENLAKDLEHRANLLNMIKNNKVCWISKLFYRAAFLWSYPA